MPPPTLRHICVLFLAAGGLSGKVGPGVAAPMATAATAVSIRAGTGPIGVAVNPQTGTVDVAISGSNNVSVISG